MKSKIKKLLSLSLAIALVVSGIVFSPKKDVEAKTPFNKVSGTSGVYVVTRTSFKLIGGHGTFGRWSSFGWKDNMGASVYYKYGLQSKRRIFASSSVGSKMVGSQNSSTLDWSYTDSNSGVYIRIHNYDIANSKHALDIEVKATKNISTTKTLYLATYDGNNKLKTLTETLTINVVKQPATPSISDFKYWQDNNLGAKELHNGTYYSYKDEAKTIIPVAQNAGSNGSEYNYSINNTTNGINITYQNSSDFGFSKNSKGTATITICPFNLVRGVSYGTPWDYAYSTQGGPSNPNCVNELAYFTGSNKTLNINCIGAKPTVVKTVSLNNTGVAIPNADNYVLGYSNNDSMQINYHLKDNDGAANNPEFIAPESNEDFDDDPSKTLGANRAYVDYNLTGTIASFSIIKDATARQNIATQYSGDNPIYISYLPRYEYTNAVVKQRNNDNEDYREIAPNNYASFDKDGGTKLTLGVESSFETSCKPYYFYLEYLPGASNPTEEYNIQHVENGTTYYCKKVNLGDITENGLHSTRDSIITNSLGQIIPKWYIDVPANQGPVNKINVDVSSMDDLYEIGNDDIGYYIKPTNNVNSGYCKFTIKSGGYRTSKQFTFYKTGGIGNNIYAIQDIEVETLKREEGNPTTYGTVPKYKVCTDFEQAYNNNITNWVNGYINASEYYFTPKDDGICSVDKNGTIIGLKSGTTTVVAKRKNAIQCNYKGNILSIIPTFNIKVNVFALTKNIKWEDAEQNANHYTASVGDKVDLSKYIEVQPAEEAKHKFKFTVTKGQNSATIDANTGVLTTKSIGKVYIVAYTTDGSTDEEGNPLQTEELEFSVTAPPPSKIVLTNTNEGINLSWNGNQDVASYKIYKAENNDINGEYSEIALTSGTSYTDVDVQYGKKYCYYVTSIAKNDDSLESLPSTKYSHKYTVNAPILKSVEKEGNRVKLTIGGEKYSGYVLYYGTSNNPTTAQATFSAKTAEISLPKHGTYYFRVKAYATQDDKNYYSDYSNQIKFNYSSNTTTSTTLTGTVTPTVKKTQITIKIGKKKLKITNSVAKKIKFKSSNKKVLTISKKGKIKYKKKGKATVSFKYNGKKYKIKFVIKKKGKKKFKVTAKFKGKKYKFTIKR